VYNVEAHVLCTVHVYMTLGMFLFVELILCEDASPVSNININIVDVVIAFSFLTISYR